MSDKLDQDQANQPNTTPGRPEVSDDVMAQAEAAVAGLKAGLKASLKDSMVDLGREQTGQLRPPETPRHRRRPRL
jgi:hypothetical protein